MVLVSALGGGAGISTVIDLSVGNGISVISETSDSLDGPSDSPGLAFRFRIFPLMLGRYSHWSPWPIAIHRAQGCPPPHRTFCRLQEEQAFTARLTACLRDSDPFLGEFDSTSPAICRDAILIRYSRVTAMMWAHTPLCSARYDCEDCRVVNDVEAGKICH